MSVLLPAAPLAALATAEAFVMIRGKFVDLSVGVTASAAAVLAVSVSPHGTIPAVLAALAVGATIGLANGIGVGVFRGNPIIVTLGMSSVVGAITLAASGGSSSTLSPGMLNNFGTASLAGIPEVVLAVALILIVTAWWFAVSRWGRMMRLAGDSELGFRVSGGRPVAGTIVAFVLAGLFSAVAGILLASYVQTLDFTIAANDTLPAIAGAVIGGVSLFGGEGSPWRAGFGAVLFGFLTSVLLLAGLSPYQEEIVEGVLVVTIVYLTEKLLGR
ncbi:ABC transporter permease [Conexibacter sp. S30A1]|uniref:ABC transporter permease n=1 Tax=Conexibacter sp. S30A1 TaxID=2937800 RepID=UPI00200D3383|nr:ABC transporter permease [Conexibacter sp. S30A1]